MKRKICCLLSLIILSTTVFSFGNISAKEALPCLSLTGGYAAENSTTVVTASINKEIDLAAYSISLYFDPSMLEFIDASCISEYGKFFSGESMDDCVTIIWSDGQNRILNGDIFTVKFKTKNGTAGGTIPVEIGYSVLGSDSSEEIPFEAKGCEITVLNDYVWGDANCDEQVTVSDAVVIKKYVTHPTQYPLSREQFLNSDTDNSGNVDLKDCKNVLSYITK